MSLSEHLERFGLGYGRHPTAEIAADCTIGTDTKIWHFTHVMAGAKIGERCTIGQGVHIGPGVIVGDGCKIQNGAQLFEGVTLEDDVFIGPHVVFTNVSHPRAHVSRRGEFEKTLVRRGASIGANVTILCGNTIGEYALVGANTLVRREVLPYKIVVGSDQHMIGWACRCGARLFHMTCPRCNTYYKGVSRAGFPDTLEPQER